MGKLTQQEAGEHLGTSDGTIQQRLDRYCEERVWKFPGPTNQPRRQREKPQLLPGLQFHTESGELPQALGKGSPARCSSFELSGQFTTLPVSIFPARSNFSRDLTFEMNIANGKPFSLDD
jgi:hypothetical protein